MLERAAKIGGWKSWTIAAALPLGCAALLLFGLRRQATRKAADPYEEWWRERERVRANGAGRSPESARNDLFV